NVLVGKNGQGKTSLLEALHVLLTGRSFRTAKLAECLGWDAGGRATLAGGAAAGGPGPRGGGGGAARAGGGGGAGAVGAAGGGGGRRWRWWWEAGRLDGHSWMGQRRASFPPTPRRVAGIGWRFSNGRGCWRTSRAGPMGSSSSRPGTSSLRPWAASWCTGAWKCWLS